MSDWYVPAYEKNVNTLRVLSTYMGEAFSDLDHLRAEAVEEDWTRYMDVVVYRLVEVERLPRSGTP
jgi:hypothetical protein